MTKFINFRLNLIEDIKIYNFGKSLSINYRY